MERQEPNDILTTSECQCDMADTLLKLHAGAALMADHAGRAGVAKSPANQAVWLLGKRRGVEIRPAPYTSPRGREIVVRNHAVGINPIDWLTPLIGDIAFPWIKYPFILGSDVAGEVVEVGAGVTRFAVGDRVLGHAVGVDKSRNSAAEGAFQKFTVLLDHMTAPIPQFMAYENAAVLPLALSTAACGLFQQDHLALAHPSSAPKRTGKTLLVWGGSTSVGSNAIQLAVAAGYDVITTASPKNFGYASKLGATQVFDYKSRTVISDIVKAFQGREIAGALAIGLGSVEACLDVVHACKGDKFVSIATPSVSFNDAPRGARRALWLVPTITRLVWSSFSTMLKSRLRGIRTKSIFGTSLLGNEVGPMIYVDYLPAALAEGRHAAAPGPLVMGRGLDRFLAGMAEQKKGVSASKIVVSL